MTAEQMTTIAGVPAAVHEELTQPLARKRELRVTRATFVGEGCVAAVVRLVAWAGQQVPPVGTTTDRRGRTEVRIELAEPVAQE